MIILGAADDALVVHNISSILTKLHKQFILVRETTERYSSSLFQNVLPSAINRMLILDRF